MAVPAFVNAGGYSPLASVATFTPAFPSPRTNNNVLISYCFVNATGKVFAITGAPGNGWIITGSRNVDGMSMAVATRLVDGTEATPVWTWTGNAPCVAQVLQFSGNATPTAIGFSSFQSANASTTVAVTGQASSANNSLIWTIIGASNNQLIGTPPPYTSLGNAANPNVSAINLTGALLTSGSTNENISQTITSANWGAIQLEIIGTGAALGPNVRVTQLVGQVLQEYAATHNVRVTQLAMQVLREHTRPNRQPFARVTQLCIQVLRTVDGITPPAPVTISAVGHAEGFGVAKGVSLPEWPAGLPQCPLLDGWQEQPQGNVLPFKPEVGPRKMARNHSAQNWLCVAAFKMNNAQVALFKSFYEIALLDGVSAFLWPHPITRVVYQWKFIPRERPDITRMTPNSSKVQFRLVRL